MKSLTADKNKIREKIAVIKEGISADELLRKSAEVMEVLEITGVFQEARNIFIYNSMPHEVDTSDLMNRWRGEKNFFLPVVVKDQMFFREYTAQTIIKRSPFGIDEPQGENFTNYSKVDLIIVPGVAFDRKQNRVGYGKGYYDRFLPQMKAPKVGICFDFQLLDTVPADNDDVKMDYIISENDLIW